MKISIYSPVDGQLLADSATGISFGNVHQGLHSDLPTLIKPGKSVETTINEMKLFLQNNGGLSATQFGFFASDSFSSGISHTNLLSDHFQLASGVTGLDFTGVPGLSIGLSGGTPADYVWLDAEVGPYETGATSTINYRFVFEFS